MNFEIIVTGTMADVIEGEDYTFWGQIVQHSKYGEQLQISRYERAKPTSKGLVKYFSSSHFKGIGLKTAQKIVDTYGDNTIDEILQHPEKVRRHHRTLCQKSRGFRLYSPSQLRNGDGFG